MDKYITKQDAKAVVVHTLKAVRLVGHTGVVGMMFDEIEELNEADVAPVIRAKWILEKKDAVFDIDCVKDEFLCSNCGCEHYALRTPEYEYCPHCGAKMEW